LLVSRYNIQRPGRGTGAATLQPGLAADFGRNAQTNSEEMHKQICQFSNVARRKMLPLGMAVATKVAADLIVSGGADVLDAKVQAKYRLVKEDRRKWQVGFMVRCPPVALRVCYVLA
jgi:hypothetical protein